ncbi:MAG: hypothetical protein IIB45_06590, partial [Candidatus Marinimicrobia bacterium]|nr:hypothetical protein [Candidatus Neomarinimicrobiota bacterium]
MYGLSDFLPGRPEGNKIEFVYYFRQSQWGIHLSTTWQVKKWNVGVAVKGLFHSLAEHYATGIGMDIGASTSFWKGNTIGLVV